MASLTPEATASLAADLFLSAKPGDNMSTALGQPLRNLLRAFPEGRFLAESPFVGRRHQLGRDAFVCAVTRALIEQLQERQCEWLGAWLCAAGWALAAQTITWRAFCSLLLDRGLLPRLDERMCARTATEHPSGYLADDAAEEEEEENKHSIFLALCDMLREWTSLADSQLAAVLVALSFLVKDDARLKEYFIQAGGAERLGLILTLRNVDQAVTASATRLTQCATPNNPPLTAALLENSNVAPRLVGLLCRELCRADAALAIANMTYRSPNSQQCFISHNVIVALHDSLRDPSTTWPMVSALAKATSNIAFVFFGSPFPQGLGRLAALLAWYLPQARDKETTDIANALQSLLYHPSVGAYAAAIIDACDAASPSARIDDLRAFALQCRNQPQAPPFEAPTMSISRGGGASMLRNPSLDDAPATLVSAALWLQLAYPHVFDVVPERTGATSYRLLVYAAQHISSLPHAVRLYGGARAPVEQLPLLTVYNERSHDQLGEHLNRSLSVEDGWTADAIISHNFDKIMDEHPLVTAMTGSATRYVGGIPKDERCIAVYVRHKGVIPLGSGPLPGTLSSASGERWPVDVREGVFDACVHEAEPSRVLFRDIETITTRAVNGERLFMGGSIGPGPTNAERKFDPDVSTNRERENHRSTSTLGCFALRTNADGSTTPGLLSTSHGFVNATSTVTITPSARDEAFIMESFSDNFQSCVISQSAAVTALQNVSTADGDVGVDAAFVGLPNAVASQYHPSLQRVFKSRFRTTTVPRITSVAVGKPVVSKEQTDKFLRVFKVGRSTGLSVGQMHHESVFIASPTTVSQWYVFSPRSARLRNLLKVSPIPLDPDFLAPGDSGSLVCCFVNDVEPDETVPLEAMALGLGVGVVDRIAAVTPIWAVTAATQTTLLL